MEMRTNTPRKRYRCRFCGDILPVWLPVPGEPNGALLLTYLANLPDTRL
jgi:hypothetical protein